MFGEQYAKAVRSVGTVRSLSPATVQPTAVALRRDIVRIPPNRNPPDTGRWPLGQVAVTSALVPGATETLFDTGESAWTPGGPCGPVAPAGPRAPVNPRKPRGPRFPFSARFALALMSMAGSLNDKDRDGIAVCPLVKPRRDRIVITNPARQSAAPTKATSDPWSATTKVTFHQLRHAFASRAHARGVTLQDLSMVMGHSSVAITADVYVHLYGREQAEERFRQAMAQAQEASDLGLRGSRRQALAGGYRLRRLLIRQTQEARRTCTQGQSAGDAPERTKPETSLWRF
jgi:Phage integrase family